MNEIEHLGKNQTGKSGIAVTTGAVFSYPTHTHAYYEMTLYAPFAGGVIINGQAFSMEAGGAVLITPSDFHRIQVSGESESHFIKVAFDESVLSLAAQTAIASPLLLRKAPADGLIPGLFREMLAHRDRGDYMAALLGALVMALARHGEHLAREEGGRSRALVLQAVRKINENFSEPVTLARVAALLSVSPPYLSEMFARSMGVTFSEYLRELRLRRAAELLRAGEATVTEVCFACGYRNLSHFLRSFKKAFGVSPGKFKETDPMAR